MVAIVRKSSLRSRRRETNDRSDHPVGRARTVQNGTIRSFGWLSKMLLVRPGISRLANGGDQRAEMAQVILISGKNLNAISAPLHRLVRRRVANEG